MPESTAAILNRWLEDNASRIAGRFQTEWFGDRALCGHQGIALDLFGDAVVGRVTVWPGRISDVEALAAGTGETLFCWSYMPFSIALLDEWLSALEAHSGLSDLPPPVGNRSGIT